jgi:hypothetical protein
MMLKITRDIIESYLNCKYKGQLKLAQQQGVKSDYSRSTALTPCWDRPPPSGTRLSLRRTRVH